MLEFNYADWKHLEGDMHDTPNFVPTSFLETSQRPCVHRTSVTDFIPLDALRLLNLDHEMGNKYLLENKWRRLVLLPKR